MSITSQDLLQRFSKIKREGSLPSCLLCTGLSSQAKHLVKVGMGMAFEELNNSQEPQRVNLKHIFSSKGRYFQFSSVFTLTLRKSWIILCLMVLQLHMLRLE